MIVARVGIDQNDFVAFVLQRLARLGSGVVEFAGLANNNGARANDHDAVKIGAFRHRLALGLFHKCDEIVE